MVFLQKDMAWEYTEGEERKKCLGLMSKNEMYVHFLLFNDQMEYEEEFKKQKQLQQQCTKALVRSSKTQNIQK